MRREQQNGKGVPVKKHSEESNLTNMCVRTCSVKPPKFECQYCEKNFSISKVLQGHIQNYHKENSNKELKNMEKLGKELRKRSTEDIFKENIDYS